MLGSAAQRPGPPLMPPRPSQSGSLPLGLSAIPTVQALQGWDSSACGRRWRGRTGRRRHLREKPHVCSACATFPKVHPRTGTSRSTCTLASIVRCDLDSFGPICTTKRFALGQQRWTKLERNGKSERETTGVVLLCFSFRHWGSCFKLLQ